MNIGQAKTEITRAVRAYLTKDERGDYIIPAIRQRPILLMGPPGIGKTQIMEQIAQECDLALVAYTITHHTRQSAIGLPYIQKKQYAGQERAVTEYTMSEIIASVYDTMEESGRSEGILFIDEINCASESLAPAMLQFLQGKTFGNQKVPRGWIIVAAGNPPEYNRSVREFDVVTLDRVKEIQVEADYDVWKAYARSVGIHGSILTYLDIHKENFYRMETTVDGKWFVTARGWEDLSEMMYVYEQLDLPVTRELVIQYLRHPGCASDFATFYDLYRKYRSDYQIDEILSGTIRSGTLNKLKFAQFDERLEVVGLILTRLLETFRKLQLQQELTDELFARVKTFRKELQEHPQEEPKQIWEQQKQREKEYWQARLKAGHNEKQVREKSAKILDFFTETKKALDIANQYSSCNVNGYNSGLTGKEAEDEAERAKNNIEVKPANAFEIVKECFEQRSAKLEQLEVQAGDTLEYAFDFMETAFGEGQEMVVFITELSASTVAIQYLREHDHPRYYKYNKSLLFDEREDEIHRKLDEIRELQRGERE